MKYTAIDITKKPIMSYYADSEEAAIRAFDILLRGRPGIDYHTIWVRGGKLVISK